MQSARYPALKGGPNFLLKKCKSKALFEPIRRNRSFSIAFFSWSNHVRHNAMGQVIPFRRENAFLPEITSTMGEAYDTAIASLQDDAKYLLIIRERIAKRIMKAAYDGEIDEQRLRQSGLSGFRGLTKGSEKLVVTVRDLLPDNTFWG
jgi:hypothetical protein